MNIDQLAAKPPREAQKSHPNERQDNRKTSTRRKHRAKPEIRDEDPDDREVYDHVGFRNLRRLLI